MSAWKVSHYTSLFPGKSGELLLCNSFMGAMTRIAAVHREAVLTAVSSGLSEDASAEPLAMLCKHGYFVPHDVDEVGLVSGLLERERDRSGFELIVLPHENCNFRCVYCYEKFERGKMRRPVVEGLKRLVRTQAGPWGRVHISWFGGEPLLASDVIYDLSDSFLESCELHNVRYSSAMTTNGYYLTPDVAENLLQRKVKFFQITVDGGEHEHNARRHLAGGGPTYETVFANLVALHERQDTFTVRLRVNFDPDSETPIERWLETIAPLFAGDPRFELAFHPIGRWGGANDANLHVCDEDAAWKSKLSLVESSMRRGFNAATYRGFLASHGSTCYAGRASSIVVGSDGQLYKCTVAFSDERNHVGKLTQDGVLDINVDRWKLWVETEHLDTKKCSSCWFNPACQSRSCPLVALDHGTPPCPTQPEEMSQLIHLTAYGQRSS